jgi:aspartyl protease family protein
MPMMPLSAEMIASLVYLTILIVAVIGYVFFSTSGKQPAGRTVQQALIWVTVFVGVIAGYGLWQDVSKALMPRQAVFGEGASVAIPKARDGHYYMTLQINGAPVSFVVDTGASEMVLSARDAVRAGLEPQDLVFSGRASTANGVVQTARVTLEQVTLGEVVERDVPAIVNGGKLDTSLLGMSYLSRWNSVMILGDRMILAR